MVSILASLRGKGGDVRVLRGLSSGDTGMLDLSSSEWSESTDVFSRLMFTCARIANSKVGADFVDCAFSETEFTDVSSASHFLGSGNTFDRCNFHRVRLVDVISPDNVFRGCSFHDVALSGYRPCRTLFDSCSFDGLGINGMKAVPSPSGSSADGVSFLGCDFKSVVFTGCHFAGVSFLNCRFENVVAEFCDTRGVSAAAQWKSGVVSDPLEGFVLELMRGIERRLGPGARSISLLSDYLIHYISSGRTETDYSACLYDGKIDDEELDAVEDLIGKIKKKYVL
jgi:uncharacterized protein YjbI with pentapeptide repeats